MHESLGVAELGEVVDHTDASLSLLEGEVAHIGNEQNQLLLVIGAPMPFVGRFNNDDAGRIRGLLGQRACAVSKPIVGNEYPTAILQIVFGGSSRCDLALKRRHPLIISEHFVSRRSTSEDG